MHVGSGGEETTWRSIREGDIQMDIKYDVKGWCGSIWLKI